MLYDFFRHIHFAYPAVLGLLILLPFLFIYLIKKSRISSLKVSTAYAFRVRSWKNRFIYLPHIIRMLALAVLVIALAGPQKKYEEQRTEGEGIDIMLCMDVSGSMGSRDILPSRIEAAKEMAIEFVRSRPVDRIGLVIFSGESFTQCPLTTNRNSLITQITSLESRRYLIDGTVIGEGLATAVDRLSSSTSKSKVIILLTDGKEDPPETRLIDPLTALEIAKSRKVKVYTIGMSAAPSTIVEITNRHANPKQAASDFLDENLLTRIANETGGMYFRVRDKQGLKTIYNRIDQLEKSKIEITTIHRVKEMFRPFILAALALVFFEFILKFSIFRKFP